MAHEDQTPDARVAFAEYHLLRVLSGEALKRQGPASVGISQAKWDEIAARVEKSVRLAAARILVAS